MLTHFRKRFPADVIAQTNAWIVDRMIHPEQDEDEDLSRGAGGTGTGQKVDKEEEKQEPSGTLILDATCAPQDIQFPTDVRLLSEARELLERSESGERNAIEGKFGEGKSSYSLGRVMMRRQDTSETSIHLTFLVMNLQKILREFFAPILLGLFWLKRERKWLPVFC